MVNSVDRNVDGILHYMRRYMAAREQQVLRINPRLSGLISDVVWLHLEILRTVLQKGKSFGGEKYRVADILTGADEAKRRALLSTSGDQNSIMDEIIERSEDTGKAGDQSIHDMRTLFRSIDPSLENLVQLIQHWIKWDLPDAADLHAFDEQIRRLHTLRNLQLNDEIRSRYRAALGKSQDANVTDAEIFDMELRRLDQIAARFCNRRLEDEPYELVICRGGCDDSLVSDTCGQPAIASGGGEGDAEPYNYKLRQCDTINGKLAVERDMMREKASA